MQKRLTISEKSDNITQNLKTKNAERHQQRNEWRCMFMDSCDRIGRSCMRDQKKHKLRMLLSVKID